MHLYDSLSVEPDDCAEVTLSALARHCYGPWGNPGDVLLQYLTYKPWQIALYIVEETGDPSPIPSLLEREQCMQVLETRPDRDHAIGEGDIRLYVDGDHMVITFVPEGMELGFVTEEFGAYVQQTCELVPIGREADFIDLEHNIRFQMRPPRPRRHHH